MEVVPDILTHVANLEEELENVEYKTSPYNELLKKSILPYSEIVYLYLLKNQLPIPPIWYQEDHEELIMLLMLLKHFPTFAPYLGELYTARLKRYLDVLVLENISSPNLLALIFEDLISFK